MNNSVITKNFSSPKVDRNEILRYLGAKKGDLVTENLLDSCLFELEEKLKYLLCYTELSIGIDGDEIDLGFTRVSSHSLAINLSGCDKIILFCATVGIEADRLMTRYSTTSPSRTAMLGAIGSERVEALCDEFCASVSLELKERGYSCRPRYSPGYGDLSLEVQRDIFRTLEPSKRIGVSLGDSLFMTPTKSVTAIIGLYKDN